jgi:thymidylate kinase
MDGPQVERMTRGLKPSKLIRALVSLENKYYEQISMPDLLVVLRVAPDISIQRKPDECSDSVRSRAEEIWNMDWSKTPAHLVEASRVKTEVLSDLMSLIWSNL